jgi:TfoX/Sxy family transcriptional regulator of competence genes
MKQRAFMKNDFWRIINEKICIRKIILVIFDESNMNNIIFRRYEQNCCFHCTKNEEFIARINLCIRSRFVKSQAKASSYKRKIVKKTLKIWRNRRELNEFILNYIIDDDDYEFFFDDNVIKNIIKNVHLMKIVENFFQISMNWSRD